MDKKGCKEFREKFADAIKGLEEEMRCNIEIGSITFHDNGLHTKLTLTENDENGEKVSQNAIDFKRHAFAYGLQPEDLGKPFISHGERYTIEGCKPKSRKYPILGKRADGKVFKFTASGVKFGMKMAESRNA